MDSLRYDRGQRGNTERLRITEVRGVRCWEKRRWQRIHRPARKKNADRKRKMTEPRRRCRFCLFCRRNTGKTQGLYPSCFSRKCAAAERVFLVFRCHMRYNIRYVNAPCGTDMQVWTRIEKSSIREEMNDDGKVFNKKVQKLDFHCSSGAVAVRVQRGEAGGT